MYSLVEDDSQLKKCNTIQNKISGDIKKEFDSKPAYNKTFLKTKVKSYNNEVTDIYKKEIAKVESNYTIGNQLGFSSQER